MQSSRTSDTVTKEIRLQLRRCLCAAQVDLVQLCDGRRPATSCEPPNKPTRHCNSPPGTRVSLRDPSNLEQRVWVGKMAVAGSSEGKTRGADRLLGLRNAGDSSNRRM
jgi:hypothetical protein